MGIYLDVVCCTVCVYCMCTALSQLSVYCMWYCLGAACVLLLAAEWVCLLVCSVVNVLLVYCLCTAHGELRVGLAVVLPMYCVCTAYSELSGLSGCSTALVYCSLQAECVLLTASCVGMPVVPTVYWWCVLVSASCAWEPCCS